MEARKRVNRFLDMLTLNCSTFKWKYTVDSWLSMSAVKEKVGPG